MHHYLEAQHHISTKNLWNCSTSFPSSERIVSKVNCKLG